ncbi:MAG: hypothetical protein LBE91_03645, partial [Tannerella sp.]|nr:hypothetical protein [Tannerella sp.]
MKKTFKFMPGVFLTLTLCCCNNPKPTGETVALPEMPSVTVPTELDSIIGIKNWLAIGPFGFNPLVTDPLKTFAREDLKPYGIREGLLDDAALEKLQKKGAEMFSIEASSLPIRLFEHVREDIKNKSNLYLASRIHSEKAQDATLILDGSYSYAVWLNGIKQVGVKGKYNTNKIG